MILLQIVLVIISIALILAGIKFIIGGIMYILAFLMEHFIGILIGALIGEAIHYFLLSDSISWLVAIGIGGLIGLIVSVILEYR